MKVERPGGPVRASRAARSAHRRRSRKAVALSVVVALAAGIWWVKERSGDAPAAPGSSGSPLLPGARGDARLLALSIAEAPAPYLAVVGTGPGGANPGVIPIPAELSILVPGQGETPATGVAALPGPSVQVALSNAVGTWIDEYAVIDVPGLEAIADRLGGLSVNLAEPVSTNVGLLGPGPAKLTGDQLGALMAVEGGDTGGRWGAVLTGLLASRLTLRRTDLVSVSSLERVQQWLGTAAGAQILPMPIRTAAGASVVAQQPEFDQLLASTWGTQPPSPVIVQNGNGEPGVGEAVARLIIPAGFRVVISQNAQSFDIPRTDVIANGLANAELARRVRRALGVGRVQASQVPSGIGDITIVVGKDFTA